MAFETISGGYVEPPSTEFALHDVLSRVLACIVNEQLAHATLNLSTGKTIISQDETLAGKTVHFQTKQCDYTEPIAGKTDVVRITFLDPADLQRPSEYTLDGNTIKSPAELVNLLCDWHPQMASRSKTVLNELASCFSQTVDVYKGPIRPCPSLTTAYLDWENSLLNGHATHPMFKARLPISDEFPTPASAELVHPTVKFVTISKSKLWLRGSYLEDIKPLLHQVGISGVSDDLAVIPVHGNHIAFLLQSFPELDIKVLPQTCPAKAQASVRTLTFLSPGALEPLDPNVGIKLPLALKVTSALRTITPWTTQVGPSLAPHWDRMEHLDQSIFHICREDAAVSLAYDDFDKAKFLACIIRKEPTAFIKPGEGVALCGGIVERVTPFTEEPVVVRAWKLNTPEKRVAFLQEYVTLLFKCLLPPLVQHGFAFEAHGQNTLVHFDNTTGKLLGFSVRDFGGIKVWQDTFEKTTGHRVEMLPGNETEGHELHQVYEVAYHTLVQSHLHRLVRALGLHYRTDGRSIGWEIVRNEFLKYIPKDTELYSRWIDGETVSYKCFIRMKLEGLYRDYTYRPVPNLINLGKPTSSQN